MDVNALRELAIAATEQALRERYDVAPGEDSDEWEAEYRRQFARLREQHNVDIRAAAPPPAAAPAADDGKWPELTGTLEERRWGTAIRAERFAEIPVPAVRHFLVQTWPRAKQWIDTRDVPTPVLLQRLKPRYDDYRRQVAERSQARKDEAAARAAALAAHNRRLADAGITPEGLVELIDASERAPAAPLAEKLAEIAVGLRHLRVFATADPNILLVKEKTDRGHEDYGIERDEGLVADLKLFGEAP
jgi:hypothetical protein